MKKTNDLYAFLRKHRAVKKFKANIENDGNPMTFEEIVKCGANDPWVLSESFTWSRTPEGHNYWDALDEKYRLQFKHTS